MAREPQRAAQPRPLNAHIVPVERALLARAKALEEEAEQIPEGTEGVYITTRLIAREFRTLAAELHHW